MLRHFLSQFGRARHLLVALTLFALLPSVSFAQSACTAMWATFSSSQAIGYYNGSAGTASKWTQVAAMPAAVTNANGLGGDSTTGLLWFYDRGAGLKLYSFNPNTYAFSAGVALSTVSPSGNGNILGATFDGAGNLYLLSSLTPNYHIAQVTDKATGATSA